MFCPTVLTHSFPSSFTAVWRKPERDWGFWAMAKPYWFPTLGTAYRSVKIEVRVLERIYTLVNAYKTTFNSLNLGKFRTSLNGENFTAKCFPPMNDDETVSRNSSLTVKIYLQACGIFGYINRDLSFIKVIDWWDHVLSWISTDTFNTFMNEYSGIQQHNRPRNVLKAKFRNRE